MRVVRPIVVNESNLISSNLVDEYPQWSAGEYEEGDRVILGMQAWEALLDTSAQPGTSSEDWLRLGYSNRWRMFREGRDSVSEGEGQIDVTISTGEILTTAALLGLVGAEVSITITDPVEGVVFNKTESLAELGVLDWWEYFFLPYETRDTAVFDGIPPYPGANTQIVVSGGSETDRVTVGRLVVGAERDLGLTLQGTSVSLIGLGKRDRDPFGNLQIVPGRSVRLVEYDVLIDRSRTEFVVRFFENLLWEPTLFIGDKDEGPTVVFGVYRDATTAYTGPCNSLLSIQVEGY